MGLPSRLEFRNGSTNLDTQTFKKYIEQFAIYNLPSDYRLMGTGVKISLWNDDDQRSQVFWVENEIFALNKIAKITSEKTSAKNKTTTTTTWSRCGDQLFYKLKALFTSVCVPLRAGFPSVCCTLDSFLEGQCRLERFAFNKTIQNRDVIHPETNRVTYVKTLKLTHLWYHLHNTLQRQTNGIPRHVPLKPRQVWDRIH